MMTEQEQNNWQMASNSQLKEELSRLETEFGEKQSELKNIVSKIDELHNELNDLSKTYNNIKDILYKREGKK